MVLLLISGLTMFIAGLGANFEYDLKKIIALSTLRQLGLMIITISVGLSGLAFFHLLTHALFKALLFMCAGGVIHSMSDSQDIRFMGVYLFIYLLLLLVSWFLILLFVACHFWLDFILEIFSMRYINIFGFVRSMYVLRTYFIYLYIVYACSIYNSNTTSLILM
jgi:NADH-ubiquinone oxidoreductase chain 5